MAELKKILGYPANDVDKILQQSVYSVADNVERDGLPNAIKTTYRTVYVRTTGKFYHWENGVWNEDESGSIVLDTALSDTSENGVQNKVITEALGLKQDTLTAGENITIENNVISAKGGDLTNYYTKDEVNVMLPFSEDISGGNV